MTASALRSALSYDAATNSSKGDALALLVRIVTAPAVREQTIRITAAILHEARTTGSILADPAEADPKRKGALEVAIDALHGLEKDDQHLLEIAFSGMLGDLCDLPDHVLQYQTLPPSGPWLTDPAVLLDAWLRWTESASGKRLLRIDADMGIDRAHLADLLNRIENEDDRALIHGGHLRRALLQGRPLGGLTEEESDHLIRGFARVLAVIVAHFRVALLGRWNRKPLGDLVSFDHEWQTLARCMVSGVVAPATAILPILNLTSGPESPSDLPAYFERTPLADPAFIALVREAAARCPGVGTSAHGFDRQMARVQAEIFRKTRDVAAIRKEDLVKDGLGRMSFVEDRLGMSASRGSVLAAWSMLSAPKAIDICIEAVRAGRPLPALPRPVFHLDEKAIGLRRLGRATDHLRREVMPDREAAKMHNARSFNNNAGLAMLRKAVHSFADRHPQRAIDALWIDPRAWFA